MAICPPNFNYLAFMVSEIQPLELLFSEICIPYFGFSSAPSDAILVSPSPPISTGITEKKIIKNACAVTITL